ncbi:MAG: hypothetical protein JSW38_03335 [Dehalococcoidia bacterium]|nr:MAG: hypothetical protein JSW38_03335 [Dehalococcoidia bacterium]
MSRIKGKLQKYLSGKLVIVQIGAGCGAFIGRSIAVLLLPDYATWNIVIIGIVGSTVGYIGTYAIGYWLAFRRDYRESSRFMPFDVGRLQIVEQMPNLGTFIASGVTQGALIGGTGLHPVLAVNLGSWFGPHKIINLVAMLTSNSLKKAWVDGTWRPIALVRNLVCLIMRITGFRAVTSEQSAVRSDIYSI